MNAIDKLRQWLQPQRQLREQQQQMHDNYALLREQLAELEVSLLDSDWRRMSSAGDLDFSRQGLRAINRISRIMYLKNPLVRRAVRLQALYVWAQGCTITSTDDATQRVIERFMSDPRNQCVLTSHQGRVLAEVDLQVDGNLFFALFGGGPSGEVQVRTIDPDEIEEIICDPNDAQVVWFYKRVWSQSSLDLRTGTSTTDRRCAYYPDIRYPADAERMDSIGRDPVLWESPVYHVKVGGLSRQRFGVPETYSAHDWARAYNEFLANWATIVRAYAQFAFNLKTAGGPQAVSALKSRLNASDGSGSGVNRNPSVQTASTFISTNADLTPVKTAGATTSAADGMYLALMVGAATGTPYPMLMGDPSTGNLATAKTLDRPTELRFRDRQELWRSIMITILEHAVERSRGAAGGIMRPYGDDYQSTITVEFPPILEHDITESVNSIVAAATLDGKAAAGTIPREQTSRMLLSALGVANVEEVIQALDDEDFVQQTDEPVRQAVEALREQLRGGN